MAAQMFHLGGEHHSSGSNLTTFAGTIKQKSGNFEVIW